MSSSAYLDGLRDAKHIVDDLPDARLVAVCRRTRDTGERIAATFRCKYFEDYQTLLAHGDIDAVIVVVPPVLHLATIEAACREGKHVLVEKPLAVTVATGFMLPILLTTVSRRRRMARGPRAMTALGLALSPPGVRIAGGAGPISASVPGRVSPRRPRGDRV